eukprot:279409_1
MGQVCAPTLDTKGATLVIQPQHLTVKQGNDEGNTQDYTGSITVALFKDENKIIYQASETCECYFGCGLCNAEIALDDVTAVDKSNDHDFLHEDSKRLAMKIETKNNDIIIMSPVSQQHLNTFVEASPISQRAMETFIESTEWRRATSSIVTPVVIDDE